MRSKAVGEMPGGYWSSILRSAKARNIIVTITPQHAWDVFLLQGRKCSLTQLPLTFKSEKKNRCYGTASLDRIDSDKGYIEGNVWWLHKDINLMKMDLNLEHFKEMCRLVAESEAFLMKYQWDKSVITVG